MTLFRDAIAGFDGAMRRCALTFAEIPRDMWTMETRHSGPIADIVEHMAISNGLFARRLDAVFAAPPGAQRYSEYEDDEIHHLFERADEPPGVAQPTGTWRDRDEALARFAESAAPLLAHRDRDDAEVRVRGAAHPLFGPMDALQWALFAAAHTERHRSQIIGLQRKMTA